jgi:DNA modification methylase
VRRGFHGLEYQRLRGDLRAYDDRFDDYWGFLEPRLVEAWRLLAEDGTLYVHLDYREAHYAKVLMDALFGREQFLNELIWAYDYGAKTRKRWPTKHDTILVYVKDRSRYWFDSDAVDREPYMAPGLVTPEKAARGKLPTDVSWWSTIRRPAARWRSAGRGSAADAYASRRITTTVVSSSSGRSPTASRQRSRIARMSASAESGAEPPASGASRPRSLRKRSKP